MKNSFKLGALGVIIASTVFCVNRSTATAYVVPKCSATQDNRDQCSFTKDDRNYVAYECIADFAPIIDCNVYGIGNNPE